jgi:predicted DNA-binding transcriptional regulator AlpA
MYNYNYNKTFSVREVSEIIGVERSAIYRLIKNRKLIPNITRPIRIAKTNLQTFVLKKAPKAPLLWEKER